MTFGAQDLPREGFNFNTNCNMTTNFEAMVTIHVALRTNELCCQIASQSELRMQKCTVLDLRNFFGIFNYVGFFSYLTIPHTCTTQC